MKNKPNYQIKRHWQFGNPNIFIPVYFEDKGIDSEGCYVSEFTIEGKVLANKYKQYEGEITIGRNRYICDKKFLAENNFNPDTLEEIDNPPPYKELYQVKISMEDLIKLTKIP